jgi:hypothetical protein
MKNPCLGIFLFLSIAAINFACSNDKSSDPTITPVANAAPPKSKPLPVGDIYRTEYSICGTKVKEIRLPQYKTKTVVDKDECISKRYLYTWSKPSQMGVLYHYNDAVDRPIPKMPPPGDDMIGVSISLVFKSKGEVPGLSYPLPTEKFYPKQTNGDLISPRQYYKIVDISGSLRIQEIKKLSAAEANDAMDDSFSDKSNPNTGVIYRRNYYFSIKNNPIDAIKPQQIYPITWQDGQPPQVIPFTKW